MTGGAGPQAGPFTLQQRADLAKLLARHLTIGSMQSLAQAVLHRDISKEAANELASREAYADRLVEILAAAGALGTAISQLRMDASRNGGLMLGLNAVLEGGDPVDIDANLQNFVDDYEPFISPATFEKMLPRVRRTVCAIGLDMPGARALRGTGFLIGPDLVITNYHVLAPVLQEVAGEIRENGPGDRIYCFFDYDSAPQPLIPPAAIVPTQIAQGLRSKWLVCARPALRNDGTDTAEPFTNQLDFAVIQLARPIGSLPARLSGGARRGWLTLEQQIAVDNQPRLVLFQHPGQKPQRFDIGPFHKLDESKSRVWYWLNSSKGSSGGAAVDTAGRLFAIHNAEVTRASERQPGKVLNQGIRIDRIAEVAPRCVFAQPEIASQPFWSLTDDIKSPEPVIGRSVFRTYVEEVAAPTGPRVLVVTGPDGAGVRFSIRLLKRIVGTQTPVVEISASELEQLEPKKFLRVLVNALGMPEPKLPDPKGTEDIPRWIRKDLVPLLQTTLSSEEARARSRFPAWVVINTLVPAGRHLLWADNLPELVGALVGVQDAGQHPIDVPQLRWLFLGHTSLALPLGGIEKREEDLALPANHAADFAECMQSAREAVNPAAEAAQPDILMAMARREMKGQPNRPPRQVLANVVEDMVGELAELLVQERGLL